MVSSEQRTRETMKDAVDLFKVDLLAAAWRMSA